MLTPRLQKIADFVNSKVIADIGTDHAYIPIELMRCEKISRAIACDINPGPLDIAKSNIAKYGLSENIETRLANGLSALAPGEAEEIIIAGMGGKLIADIIKDNLPVAQKARLILQPMNAQAELRQMLFDIGFQITREALAIEGFKVYNIMCVQPGDTKPYDDEIHYHLPPSLYSDPLFPKLCEKKLREFKKIYEGNNNSSQRDEELLEYYSRLIEKAEKLLEQTQN